MAHYSPEAAALLSSINGAAHELADSREVRKGGVAAPYAEQLKDEMAASVQSLAAGEAELAQIQAARARHISRRSDHEGSLREAVRGLVEQLATEHRDGTTPGLRLDYRYVPEGTAPQFGHMLVVSFPHTSDVIAQAPVAMIPFSRFIAAYGQSASLAESLQKGRGIPQAMVRPANTAIRQ